MTDAATVVVGVLIALAIIAIIVVIALAVAWGFRQLRRRRAYERAGVSHLDLYFDEHFPNVIRNFDLVSSARFDTWSNGINARLGNLARDLDNLGKARRGLDNRMDKLEKRLTDLE